MNNPEKLTELYRKYIANRCTPDELAVVLMALRTEEGVQQLQQVMDEEAAADFVTASTIDPALSAEIFAQIEKSMQKLRASEKTTGHFYVSTLWKIAAAVVGLLLAAGALYGYYAYQTKTLATLTTLTTAYGQQKTVVLPDQSTVFLNANSTLSYSQNWQDAPIREVHLEGEAFFKVTRNKARPFVVRTANITVQVLGTSFNVKSYQDDETVETTLVEGKVTIQSLASRHSSKTKVVLYPNQQAVFSKKSDSISLLPVKPERYTSWKSGRLIFEDEPLEEIVKDLERRYGVDIHLPDNTARACRFSAKIGQESLKEVLDLFSASTSLQYRIENKDVFLNGSLCQ